MNYNIVEIGEQHPLWGMVTDNTKYSIELGRVNVWLSKTYEEAEEWIRGKNQTL